MSSNAPKVGDDRGFRLQPEGLCASCRHAKRITSSKGSEFLLCGLSEADDRFRKYPPLPVLSCVGYTSPR
jgi:hypothetical protein